MIEALKAWSAATYRSALVGDVPASEVVAGSGLADRAQIESWLAGAEERLLLSSGVPAVDRIRVRLAWASMHDALIDELAAAL